MFLPILLQIESAAQVVYREFQFRPQYRWVRLSQKSAALHRDSVLRP